MGCTQSTERKAPIAPAPAAEAPPAEVKVAVVESVAVEAAPAAETVQQEPTAPVEEPTAVIAAEPAVVADEPAVAEDQIIVDVVASPVKEPAPAPVVEVVAVAPEPISVPVAEVAPVAPVVSSPVVPKVALAALGTSNVNKAQAQKKTVTPRKSPRKSPRAVATPSKENAVAKIDLKKVGFAAAVGPVPTKASAVAKQKANARKSAGKHLCNVQEEMFLASVAAFERQLTHRSSLGSQLNSR